MYGKYLAACLLIGSCSCADFGLDNSGKVVVSTNRNPYATSQKFTFTVQNWGDPVAYIYHCNHRLGYLMQKEENGSWRRLRDRNAASLAVYPNGAEPIVVGYPYAATLSLPVGGMYRVEMSVGWEGAKLWDDQIYSNIFRVE